MISEFLILYPQQDNNQIQNEHYHFDKQERHSAYKVTTHKT